jgi:hypothetical protein
MGDPVTDGTSECAAILKVEKFNINKSRKNGVMILILILPVLPEYLKTNPRHNIMSPIHDSVCLSKREGLKRNITTILSSFLNKIL